MPDSILFLCPHNAAKSVLASAWCERRARDQGLRIVVHSAGTQPDPGPAPPVVELLLQHGLDLSGHRPRHLQQADLDEAALVISMGCNLDGFEVGGLDVRDWSHVPMPSQDLAGAWAIIRREVDALLHAHGG